MQARKRIIWKFQRLTPNLQLAQHPKMSRMHKRPWSELASTMAPQGPPCLHLISDKETGMEDSTFQRWF